MFEIFSQSIALLICHEIFFFLQFLTASRTFYRPNVISCTSFCFTLINCQFLRLSRSASVSVSIFLFLSTYFAQFLEWERHKKPHRQNNPVFIRDLFHFFLSAVPYRIVTASRGFSFDFPKPIPSLSRRYVRYSRPVPSGKGRKGNFVLSLHG